MSLAPTVAVFRDTLASNSIVQSQERGENRGRRGKEDRDVPGRASGYVPLEVICLDNTLYNLLLLTLILIKFIVT